MDGLPVTIRTLDPPFTNSCPYRRRNQKAGAQAEDEFEKSLGQGPVAPRANPMLGHRGCRLGVVFPEITEMQARAIFELRSTCRRKASKSSPSHDPSGRDINELKLQGDAVRRVASEVCEKSKQTIQYLVGP